MPLQIDDTMTTLPVKRVILLDNQKNRFEVTPSIIELLESTIDDNDCDIEIPVSCVSGDNLQKILDFCSHLVRESEVQATSSGYQTEHKKFIKEFFAFDMRDLAGLLNAAELLDCKPLREECLNIYVDYIQNHTSAQIRDYFGLPDDLTEEEKKEQRAKNAWCYDPLEQAAAAPARQNCEDESMSGWDATTEGDARGDEQQ